MNCRDVRDMADSFLTEQLLTETNHDILRHLDACPVCRTEIDARRRLRGALRDAFNRAPELRSSVEFQHRLRDRLRDVSVRDVPPSSLSGRWFALAAGIVLAVGMAGILVMRQSVEPTDTLARDAVGDHQNCALKFRLVRAPVPLEEAAQQFDKAYRLLLSAPPDDIATPDGPARVTERHSCAYGAHRFGHVIMEYRGHVVSLLMTANDATDGAERNAIPHVIGHPMNGLSVVSVDGTRHAILLVSELKDTELAQLASAVSIPLAGRLGMSPGPDPRTLVASAIRAVARPMGNWNLLDQHTVGLQ